MVFMSRNKRLRVIAKPSFHVLDANGQRVQISGFTAEFQNGRFETNDPEQIASMLKHMGNGKLFHAVEDEHAWIDEHPEYFHKPADMVVGSVATVNTAPIVTAARIPLKKEIRTQEEVAAAKAAVDEERRVDLDTIIDEKMNAKLVPLNEKLDRLLNAIAEPAEKSAEKTAVKKTFTCPVPGCGFVAQSGIAIGAHKKEAHSA